MAEQHVEMAPVIANHDSANQPFRLLDLSQELRDHIYEYLIIDPDMDGATIPRSDYNLYKYSHLVDMRFYRTMLQVNRQIRDEFCDTLCTIKQKARDNEVRMNLTEQPTKFYGDSGDFSFPFSVMGPRLSPLSVFSKHIRSVAVEITSFLEHYQSMQLQATSDLISALEDATELRSIRVALIVPAGGIFSFSWVKREVERFKAIQGFNLAIVDVPILQNDKNELVTLWAEAQVNVSGWKHAGAMSRSLSGWERSGHNDGFDHQCFQCWIEKQDAGRIRIPIPNSDGKVINRRIRW
jgi:hypothetical protein